jgi:hypothetical protein
MSEKPPIRMMRRGTFLVPAAPMDGDRLAELPTGKALNVRVTQPRSIGQHRLYWSMLTLVCENLDQPITPDDLHEWVKVKLGVTVAVKQRNGQTVYVPGSIAFDKMEQGEFRSFFDRAKALLVDQIIPGLSNEALEREARALLGEAACPPPDHHRHVEAEGKTDGRSR